MAKRVDLDITQAIAKMQTLLALADQWGEKLQAAATAMNGAGASAFGPMGAGNGNGAPSMLASGSGGAGATPQQLAQFAPGAPPISPHGQQVGVSPPAQLPGQAPGATSAAAFVPIPTSAQAPGSPAQQAPPAPTAQTPTQAPTANPGITTAAAPGGAGPSDTLAAAMASSPANRAAVPATPPSAASAGMAFGQQVTPFSPAFQPTAAASAFARQAGTFAPSAPGWGGWLVGRWPGTTQAALEADSAPEAGSESARSALLPEVQAVQKQISKAFPSAPAMPAGMPILDQLRYGALRQEQDNITATRSAIGLGAAYGMAQNFHAYTQAIVSGQPNPQGFASADGALFGTVAGAIIGGFAGQPLLGAALGGALGGAGGGALMAPATARLNAANELGGYAAATGQSADNLAVGAEREARAQSDRFVVNSRQNANFFQKSWDFFLRDTGLYAGTDQASTGQTAQIQAALRGAGLESGTDTRGLDAYFAGLGTVGPGAAQSAAKAIGAGPATGGNLFSLVTKVGIAPVETLLRSQGLNAAIPGLSRGFAAAETANYETVGAASVAQGSADAYAASAFSGGSVRERDDLYNKKVREQHSVVSRLDAEMVAIAATTADGKNSDEYKAKDALKSSMLREIAQEASTRAQTLVGGIQNASAVNLAIDATANTRSALRGTPDEIRAASARTVADLGEEAKELRVALDTPGLDLAQKRQMQARIHTIERDQATEEARGAGAAMRKGFLPFDVANAAFEADTAGAVAYGGPEDIRRAFATQAQNLAAEERDAERAANNAKASDEDRATARMRASGARKAGIALRAQGAGAAMRRGFLPFDVQAAEAETSISEAVAYGSDEEVSAAFRSGIANLDNEEKDAQRAASDPNLSAEDRAAARTRATGAHRTRVGQQIAEKDVALSRLGGRAAIAEGYAGNDLRKAELYGSDADVSNTGAGLLQALTDERQKLVGQIAGGGLTQEQEIKARERVVQIEGQQLDLGVSLRDTEIGRMSSRASLQNAGAANVTNRAFKLGSGEDVRRASGGLIASLGMEAGQIQDQLAKGNLTFEQEQKLQGKLLDVQRQAFDVGQDSLDAANRKDDIRGYDLPAIHLQGERERQKLLPFSPGNAFATSVGSIQLDQQQIGALDRREAQLRREGNLSPEREIQIEGEKERLLTDRAYGIAQLSEGMENHLPALAAGRPRSFGLFDSEQLAAMALYRVGSPVRSYGAINGRQAAMQDAFARGLGVDFPIGPRSRTQAMNNGRQDPYGAFAPMDDGHQAGRGGQTAGNGRSDTDRAPSWFDAQGNKHELSYGDGVSPEEQARLNSQNARVAAMSPQQRAAYRAKVDSQWQDVAGHMAERLFGGDGRGPSNKPGQRQPAEEQHRGYPQQQMPQSYSGQGNGNIEALLTRILLVLERGADSGRTGSAMRPGEQAGQALGHLSQRDVGTGYGGR